MEGLIVNGCNNAVPSLVTRRCTRSAGPACCLLACLGLFGLATQSTRADVKLPAVVSSGMVLQQQADAPVWGWARPGEQVVVTGSWDKAEARTTADANGRWQVKLRTPAAAGTGAPGGAAAPATPVSITIKGDNTVTLSDVLIGEVWVCSGQSNMEWTLGAIGPGREGVPSADAEVSAANDPNIRLFTVAKAMAAQARSDVSGLWQPCTSQSAKAFSAVAYFFGRSLRKELGVPVGLVSTSWGGTPAEAWTSAEGLGAGAFPEFKESLESLAALADPSKRATGVDRQTAAWWAGLDTRGKNAPGDRWAQPDFDDSMWPPIAVPSTIVGDGLEKFDGVFYYRTTFDVPQSWVGKGATLELGPIDDRDDTWLNGVMVGATHGDGQWATPRRYTVPASAIKAGRNVLGVRVLDTGGEAGINGKPEQLVLKSDDAALTPIKLAGRWKLKAGAAKGELPTMPENSADMQPSRPSALYNAMIAPLTSLAIRGAIWYQGEANVGRAAQYRRLLPAMITDWRRQWSGRGAAAADFPFYFVQIAPFKYDGGPGAAELREAQAATLSVPNTGMAVTMDIGNANDIHPDNKQEVGRRLALWALSKTYGKTNLSYSGPLYKSSAVEGGAVAVRFDHADGGLMFHGAEPKGWEVIDADGKAHPATAAIEGDTVLVRSTDGAKPVAARYGWGPADMPNLFNKAGLPASSFRTDQQGAAAGAGAAAAPSFMAPLPTPAKDDPEFRRLFNGRDFAGWDFKPVHQGHWKAEGGTIMFDGEGDDLWSTESFKDFVLTVDWRWTAAPEMHELPVILPSGEQDKTPDGKPRTMLVPEAGDSGIYLRGSSKSQVNIWCWPVGSGEVYGYRTDPKMSAEVRAGVTPVVRADAPIGQWNRFVIKMRGDRLSVLLNEQMVLENAQLPGVAETGRIALQKHGGAIQFANIYIKELK